MQDWPEKRRQHHVWRRYLESWSVSGIVNCLQNGEIFSNAPHNLAVQSFFYRIDEPTKDDLLLYRHFLVKKGDVYQRESHERFLRVVTSPIDMIERLRQHVDDKHGPALDEILKTYKTNALEDYYAGIEGTFGPILDRLFDDDLSVFDADETAIPLFYFLATQYMRTRRMREAWIKSFAGAPFNIERIIPLLALQFGENMGRSLFLDRGNSAAVILKNSTDTEFVTGDQPIINLLAAVDKQATELSLYYPLSPTKALLLSDSGRPLMVTNDTFNEMWAAELNRKIYESSHSQVFARSAAALEALWRPNL